MDEELALEARKKWVELAELLLTKGRNQDAYSMLTKAINTLPIEDEGVFSKYAELSMALGNYEDAARHGERYLARNPKEVGAMLDAAYIRMRMGQTGQAVAWLERALKVEPENAEAMAFLRTLYNSVRVECRVGEQENYKVSVIIPHYGSLNQVLRCIDTVYEHTEPRDWEIVIIDNSGDEKTNWRLNEEHGQVEPSLTLIHNNVNLGFARSCNQGARAAKGKYLLFLNNDVAVTTGWLNALVNVLDTDPQVGAVGAKLLNNTGTIQHAGMAVLNDQIRHRPLTVTNLYSCAAADDPDANLARECQAVSAACMLVRREAFGVGFDEAYWNGCEDVDLCFRMGAEGWKVVYEPKCVVTHHCVEGAAERTIRQTHNVWRLSDRWTAKVLPDYTVKPDGRWEMTGQGKLRVYERKTNVQ